MKYAFIVFFAMFSFAAFSQAPQDLTQSDLEIFGEESLPITSLIAIINDYKSSPDQYNPAFQFNTVIVDKITIEGFEPSDEVSREIRNYFAVPKLRDESERFLLNEL